MNILADASLPSLIEAFPPPFKLTFYTHNEEVSSLLEDQEMLLCRANLKVNQSLLGHHPVRYVATASSGSDNLDHPYLKSKNIVAFDAKGCNAVSVADYVLSCLAYLVKHQLIQGTKLGIIGLGHVGSIVYNRLKAADLEILCFDPLKAEHTPHFSSCEQESLYQCDILCIHTELHKQAPYPSYNLIDEFFLKKLKPGCIIINAARGGIVNEQALLDFGSSLVYCTDVYLNEPKINSKIIAKATLCTPHIAGHSLEAKSSAVSIISKKIHEHLGWAPPLYTSPTNPRTITKTSWQEFALTLYNPIIDTQLLKNANNLERTFIELRKKHTYRHDFYTYLDMHADNKIKKIIFAL